MPDDSPRPTQAFADLLDRLDRALPRRSRTALYALELVVQLGQERSHGRNHVLGLDGFEGR